MKRMRAFLPLILTIFISACSFSLASEITPPPGAKQPAIQASTQEAQTGPIYPLVSPDPALGAANFAEKCAPCHGEAGRGDGPSASELPVPMGAIGTAIVSRHATPAEWYTLITDGDLERYMPPFSNLTDRQRWDLVAYVYSLSAPSESIALGQELYQANCAQCHGPNGQGDGPEAANLASAARDFTDQAFMAETSAASMYAAVVQGIDPVMPAFAQELNDVQVWAITDYLRSLTFATQPQPAEEEQVEQPVTPESTTEVDISTSQPVETVEPGTTAATTLGQVIVTVVNGTGGEVPFDTPVTLYAFDNMQMAFTQTLTTGENGVYSFENIEMLPERAFLAGVDYSGGTYGSDVATADPAVPVINLQITTYGTSSDASVLIADRLHIFLDLTDPEMLQVTEIYIISNPTDQSIVPEDAGGPVAFFPLPEGYQNLSFGEGMLGDQYLEVPGGFADTVSVPPGMSQYQVVAFFTLPYDRRLTFTQDVAMNTSAVVIMLPDNGVSLSGELLQDGGLRDIQDVPYRMYSSNNLGAGSLLSFEISGRPGAGDTSLLSGNFSWKWLAWGAGFVGMVLVGVGLWLYQRNKNTVYQPAGVPQIIEAGIPAGAEDAEALMDAIIALDDQYQAGELPEDAYQQRRAELKGRLRNLR